jgi:ferric-dicitrate binding protein FerR (iron transport regulator)
MEENRIDEKMIELFFNKNYSEEESSYVNDIFCDNNNEKKLDDLLRKQFYGLLSEDDVDKEDLDHILYKIHYDINTKIAERKERKFSKLIKWSARIAGVIILPLAIFWGVKGYLNNNAGKETWVEIHAPEWTRAQFSLPDGTTGWLNSNSSIKYEGNFNINRRIILHGEAFFDVFKDRKRPFTVNTDEVSLKVLGTRFNIASYENERNVEVVLDEGELVFNNKEMNRSYTMKPNDLVIYDKVIQDYSTEVVQPHKYLSWTEGKLVFRNDPLDLIARRLERWYNIDVEIDADINDDFRLRATFIGDDLDEVLNLLKRSLPINYEIGNRELQQDGTYAKKKVIITSGK